MKSSANLDTLSPLGQELFADAMAWMEPFGDASHNLLFYPGLRGRYSALDVAVDRPHLVRESAWWAAGLLLRNQGGDLARAERVLEAVLGWQFIEPGAPHHGTFHRAPEEKLPPRHDARMWADYDPNWREFIGTTFMVILARLDDRLTPALRDRLEQSIRLAVEGETPGRIGPDYSNIAMMYAVQLVWAGDRFAQPEWKRRGLDLARQIHELYAKHQTFSEYNSPTYYAITLYALRLWRLVSGQPELEAWGAEMEAGLWRQAGLYYHSGLRNMCGPFDRAYGMDMTRYAAGMGLWMRLELERACAPYPVLNDEMRHSHDATMTPLVVLLGTDIPDDVRARFREIPRHRTIEQIIETQPVTRLATAHLQPDRMWGAEVSPRGRCWPQYHPATVHWRQPDGSVGWLRLENELPVEATATGRGLAITAAPVDRVVHLRWHLNVAVPPRIEPGEWSLPGLTLRIDTNLPTPTLSPVEEELRLVLYEVPAHQKIFFNLEFAG